MRQALNAELRLGYSPIEQVELNVNCRDEIIPILRALQQVYSEPKLRQQIVDLVAEDVNRVTSGELGRANASNFLHLRGARQAFREKISVQGGSFAFTGNAHLGRMLLEHA